MSRNSAQARRPDAARETGRLEALLDSRLVLVTGKGGTGKTSVAAALAVLAAVQGRQVLLCEVDMMRSALGPIFDMEPSFTPREALDGLDVVNIRWPEALQRFIEGIVPSRRIVSLVLENPVVQRFLDFTPGSQELVALSAIGDHVRAYDLVVVDMPASGHALSLLDITRSAMGLFRSGPVRKRATELRDLLHARSTHLVFVALPEEMVINETLETTQRLRQHDLLGSDAPMVFLNRATTPTLADDERALLDVLEAVEGLTPTEREFVRAGRWEDELEQGTATALARLCSELGEAPIQIPSAPPGANAAVVAEAVAGALGRRVGVTRRELVWR